MQGPFIELKEVIWEITGRCKNGCSYCGSKSIRNQPNPSDEEILEIATRIAAMEVPEVNISGGDPLLIAPKVYDSLSKIFAYGKLKLICNPKSFDHVKTEMIMEIWNHFDVIGLSVNTTDELVYAKKLLYPVDTENKPRWENVTIITNFNLSNMFIFEDISNFVTRNSLGWQIQFTIDDTIGVYTQPKAVELLFEKINIHLNSNGREGMTFIADNMTGGQCAAGVHSIGVCSNGDVVPCLSMRSFYAEMPVMGNLHEMDLKSIWEEGFIAWRTRCFECCKDACGNNEFMRTYDFSKLRPQPQPAAPPIIDYPQVIMYGVQETKPWSPGTIQVYGVREPSTFVYGVRNWTKTDGGTDDKG